MKQKPQQKMLSPMLFVKMSYLGKHKHTHTNRFYSLEKREINGNSISIKEYIDTFSVCAYSKIIINCFKAWAVIYRRFRSNRIRTCICFHCLKYYRINATIIQRMKNCAKKFKQHEQYFFFIENWEKLRKKTQTHNKMFH